MKDLPAEKDNIILALSSVIIWEFSHLSSQRRHQVWQGHGRRSLRSILASCALWADISPTSCPSPLSQGALGPWDNHQPRRLAWTPTQLRKYLLSVSVSPTQFALSATLLTLSLTLPSWLTLAFFYIFGEAPLELGLAIEAHRCKCWPLCNTWTYNHTHPMTQKLRVKKRGEEKEEEII